MAGSNGHSMNGNGKPPAGEARFRVTGGVVLGIVGVFISLVLGSRMNLREAATLAVVVVIATVHWLVLRRREPTGVS